MGKDKEPNEGTLPCMVCGTFQSYLNTAHMGTHDPEQPQSVPEYRDWVAEHSKLERTNPAIDSNQLLKPQLWRENEHLFEGWRSWR
ncbi:uncharacterized protein Nmlp_2910 [Natronomonas moolapensis 8.8.11]|uniref:Uncharacterized protein n=1 Tax=Natronomonas moolapensis (strain DSM 18674 / CECT 7526 / JCM 14361 / 8.8.11) TaxID=268739 RepID=M1XL46_NATM8|nr:hypothetical protein [Natronomonas moolapensis]CCQ37061.1 uncharacterized protein Nmlp_2910 [Natronomonas moolapensis 8.8.11]